MFRFIWTIGMVAAVAATAEGWTDAALAGGQETEWTGKPRVLIVYFSHSGVTKGIAERLQKKLGGALHRIEPAKAYPEEYQEVLDQARKEIDEGFKPELKGASLDLDNVDLVLVGGPVWAGTLAPPLSSFLARNSLAGKTVAPFCTYGGGIRDYFARFGEAVSKEATVLEGLGLGRADLVKGDEEIEKRIDAWLGL